MKFFIIILIIFILDIQNKLTNFCIRGENNCYKENKEKKKRKKNMKKTFFKIKIHQHSIFYIMHYIIDLNHLHQYIINI